MSAFVHTLHAVLAGVWLGGVVFTTAIVSPALNTMKWGEAERVLVRSAIGKQYAKVGTTNLVLLLVFAVLDGLLRGFGPVFYAEYALLAVVFGLVAAHGTYFGCRLVGLAEAERGAGNAEEARAFAGERHALQRLSSKVSPHDDSHRYRNTAFVCLCHTKSSEGISGTPGKSPQTSETSSAEPPAIEMPAPE